VQSALVAQRWQEGVALLEQALATYDAGATSWRGAQIRVFLVLLGGLDEALVAPIAARLQSPVFDAQFAFYRAVHIDQAGDGVAGAELAGRAVALARDAGALYQLGAALLGYGGWRARLPEATLEDVFGPLAESLELWDRLRVAWGRVAVSEEIAQALATRGHQDEAFVLWGAIDRSGILVPAMVNRHRTGPHLTGIPDGRVAAGRARGAEMTIDEAVSFARGAVAAILDR
jgi:hypothetical protein